MAEDSSTAGGKSFDLRRTLPHVLVRLEEDDVDFRDEHARQRDRRTDVDAYT